ncbi:MAG TPA: T9SS type A sorting domain-containing protein, partial [Flavisolibacter sp.]|nr:T9SS type A sorting domain-containing protein [Flavisolibacter sp.]
RETITKIISSGDYSGVEGITVYPNPVINSLHISFFTSTAILQEFRIINLEGKPVMRKENTSRQGYNLFYIDISNLIRGMYILEINSITPNIYPAKKVFKLIKV